MTHHTEQRVAERSVLPDPPPAMTERREAPLFQTINYRKSPIAQDRLYLWGGGLLLGGVLFGVLYLMILFLE